MALFGRLGDSRTLWLLIALGLTLFAAYSYRAWKVNRLRATEEAAASETKHKGLQRERTQVQQRLEKERSQHGRLQRILDDLIYSVTAG